MYTHGLGMQAHPDTYPSIALNFPFVPYDMIAIFLKYYFLPITFFSGFSGLSCIPREVIHKLNVTQQEADTECKTRIEAAPNKTYKYAVRLQCLTKRYVGPALCKHCPT